MNPPETLTDKSREVWTSIELAASRKLTEADYAMIEQFCQQIDLYDKALEEIQENGFSNEHNQVSPAVTVANKAANNIRQLYRQISGFLAKEIEEKPSLKSVKNF